MKRNPPPGSEQDYETAFGHLLRAKWIVTCAIAVLAVLTVADVAVVVSTFALDTGQPNAFVASQDLAVLGDGVGTLLLVAVGALPPSGSEVRCRKSSMIQEPTKNSIHSWRQYGPARPRSSVTP